MFLRIKYLNLNKLKCCVPDPFMNAFKLPSTLLCIDQIMYLTFDNFYNFLHEKHHQTVYKSRKVNQCIELEMLKLKLHELFHSHSDRLSCWDE